MKRSRLFFLFFSLSWLFFVFSCGSDDAEDAQIEEEISSFCPTTPGSSWTYQTQTLFGQELDYTIYIGEGQKIMDGLLYRPMVNDEAPGDTIWHSYDGIYCYEAGSSPDLGPDYQLSYFHPTAETGFTWEYEYNNGSDSGKFIFEILETNATREVLNVSYNNVTTVERTHWEFDPLSGAWEENNALGRGGISYIAENVGRIQGITDLEDIKLLTYEIVE